MGLAGRMGWRGGWAGGRLGEVPVNVPDVVHAAPPVPGLSLVILNNVVKITKRLFGHR